MRCLVQQIETLLSCHDCVVVPGLGGFLMHRTEAHYDENLHLATPSFRHVSFNAQLNFNDGLLAQAYQQDKGMSYNEANQAVRQAVADIRRHLAAGESLQLGNIGFLRETEDNRLVFEPQQCISLDADAFGLEAISCMPVHSQKAADIHQTGTERQAPVMDITLWKWAVSVAACIFLSVAFSVRPYQQNDCALQYSSVIPAYKITQTFSHQEDISSHQEETSREIVPSDICSEQPSPTIASGSNTVAYFLIVASFATQEEAERFIARKGLHNVFPDCGIAVGGSRYRVYAESYPTKEQAVGRLSDFRASNPQYAKAWVTSGKNI